jgi:hypothetical protein
MPDPNDIPRRRRVLVLDVTQAAAEVSRLTREAYDLSLPVEPGVRDGRDALVRWAVPCYWKRSFPGPAARH